jgi:hypothetical protein
MLSHSQSHLCSQWWSIVYFSSVPQALGAGDGGDGGDPPVELGLGGILLDLESEGEGPAPALGLRKAHITNFVTIAAALADRRSPHHYAQP